jgi:hypothetical protein
MASMLIVYEFDTGVDFFLVRIEVTLIHSNLKFSTENIVKSIE